MGDIPPLFGIVPTGLPVITSPTSIPAPTSFVFTLPTRSFSHIVVFLLPGIALPPDTAAAVYLATPSTTTAQTSTPNFRFLGAIGPGKESAIFKIGSGGDAHGVNNNFNTNGSSVEDRQTIVGISVEPAASVAQQMSELAARTTSHANSSGSGGNNNHHEAGSSNALVVATSAKQQQQQQPGVASTVVLAQRIIKNAFNFLASFSGNVPVPGASGVQGVEVVPLKAFEDWWRRFETRVRNDPGFLERDVE